MSCANVQKLYPGVEGQVDFSIPSTIEYLRQSDIYVALWDYNTESWDVQTRPDQWDFLNATTVRFVEAPPVPQAGQDNNVRIYRQTDISSLIATFNPGSAIRARDLNDNFEQLQFAAEEEACYNTIGGDGGVSIDLDDLNDLDVSGATDGQIIEYDGTDNKWKNTDWHQADWNQTDTTAPDYIKNVPDSFGITYLSNRNCVENGPEGGEIEGGFYVNTQAGLANEGWGLPEGQMLNINDRLIKQEDGSWSIFGTGNTVTASDEPPSVALGGDLWWDSGLTTALYFYYVDDDGGQWVPATPSGGGEGTAGQTTVIMSSDAPSTEDNEPGQLWWSNEDGRLYVLYDDGDSRQWVDASPDSPGSADLWERTGTTLSPATAGDGVDIGSGNIKLNADGTAEFDNKVLINIASSTATPLLQIQGRSGDPTDYAGFTLSRGSTPTTNSVFLGSINFTDVDPNRIGASIVATSGNGSWNPGVNHRSRLVFYTTPDLSTTPSAVAEINQDGSFLLGGDRSSVVNANTIALNANGSATFAGLVQVNKLSIPGSANCFYDNGRIVFDTSEYRVVQGENLGVRLPSGSENWVPATSESRLKDIVGDVDADQAWDLVKNIQLKRYQYKGKQKQAVSYAGPMADWLGQQDPELLIDTGEADEQGPIHTYNRGLLEIKSLQALSTALARIEELEETNASLEARLTALEGGTP